MPAHAPVYATLRSRLESNGVPIDVLDEVAADPYVRIEAGDTAASRGVSILTAAIVLRAFPELLTDTGQIQLVDDGTRVGYAYVSLDWIRAHRDGEITNEEYAKRVLETWQSFESTIQGGDPQCSR
ncbi:hypothetical protein [Natronorubrum sp. DTA7]|uniref:hypothetical protein n=1 Tax=Natronorubrum sp. DTA7 TaxID=3447016 RepID=UPI003F875FA1